MVIAVDMAKAAVVAAVRIRAVVNMYTEGVGEAATKAADTVVRAATAIRFTVMERANQQCTANTVMGNKSEMADGVIRAVVIRVAARKGIKVFGWRKAVRVTEATKGAVMKVVKTVI